MTDRTHPDSGRIITSSDILLHDAETALMYEELRAAIDDGHESMTHADALAEVAAMRAENIKLRAQLEAVGAGGVSGPLMGIAAPPTAQAEGWQSIETAPKEGVFLVFMQDEVRPARRMQVANWHPNVKIVGGLFAFDCAKVTHWMPLPHPPTSAEEVEHG